MKQKQQGILFILCAAFCFALMNLFVKLSGELPVMEKSFFRNLIAAMVAFVMVIRQKEKVQIPKGNLKYLLLRSIAGTIGILCNFYAVGQMNIADASMLNKLSPFFAMIFSLFLLKEMPRKEEWAAVVIAFVGALFVVKPSFQVESIPAFIGVLGGMGAGFAYSCVRKLGSRGVPGGVIVLFFSVFSCVTMIPGMILHFEPMSCCQFAFLLLAGASAAGGQFAITAAYTKAPAKEISVFDYVQVIFAAMLSFFVLGELPDGWSFVGYVIIIATAVWKWRLNLRHS